MAKYITLDLMNRFKEKMTAETQAAIANVDHLKRTIVTALPEPTAADSNTIYMVKKVNTEDHDNDVYDEYMLTEGKFELIGNSRVDLTDYATKDYVDGKAGNYATTAQGKKADTAVQSVKIGDTELKSGTIATIPEATQSAAGVMSTTDKKKLDDIQEATEADIDALFE